MDLVEALLALVAVCIGFALLALRLALPYAVILVLGGMVLAFVPGLPEIRPNPELALAVFLPPLLQSSAWRAFRHDLRPILALALGAVLFTAFCVAGVMRLLLPDLPWSVAIARDTLPEYRDRASHLNRSAAHRGAVAAERAAKARRQPAPG